MKVALAQLPCIDGDGAHNMASLLAAIEAAARGGAELVVAPEMHLAGFPARTELEHLAQSVDSLFVKAVAEAAHRHGIAVVAGMPERDRNTDRIYNSAFCFDRHGTVVHRYRKVHRFVNELSLVDPGDRLDTFACGGLRAGILICYDLEFPEAARTMGLAGAQLLVVPSANMAPYGRVHRICAQARALENHAFVIYCNRCGSSSDFDFEGQSAVVDPLGRVVAEAGSGAELLIVDVDPALLAASTSIYSYWNDRMPSVYK